MFVPLSFCTLFYDVAKNHFFLCARIYALLTIKI